MYNTPTKMIKLLHQLAWSVIFKNCQMCLTRYCRNDKLSYNTLQSSMLCYLMNNRRKQIIRIIKRSLFTLPLCRFAACSVYERAPFLHNVSINWAWMYCSILWLWRALSYLHLRCAIKACLPRSHILISTHYLVNNLLSDM